jgi:AbiU2
LYWKEFLELFGTNDKQIERLNKSAPAFFKMLQEQQFETNMSHLARITDSSKSVGRENLTIQSLPELVTNLSLKAELEKSVEDIREKTKFCRDWRNRRFAHHDLLLATRDSRAAPLEPATKDKIVAAMQAISDMLNVMERFYYRGGCAFDVIAAHNGVNTLLYILGFGVMGRDKMMDRIKKGDFSGGDTPENI